MSEQEVREGLRAAVAEEPALSFDPDALISQARQDIRRRRALVGAGAATATIAVAAVAVPTMLGASRGGFEAGAGDPCREVTSLRPVPSGSGYKVTVPSPGARPTASVVPLPTEVAVATPTPVPDVPCPPQPSASAPKIQWPPANVRPVYYTAEQLRQGGAEMQAHLRAEFAKIVPGASDVTVDPFGGEAAGAVADGQDYLEGFTGFTLNNQRAAVSIFVAAPGSTAIEPPQVDCPSGCKFETANDNLLMVKSEDLGKGDKILSVTIYRGNGSVVRATSYNYDPTSKKLGYLPAVPLTVAQLGALASDPKLGL
jgi:hypothetical protein